MQSTAFLNSSVWFQCIRPWQRHFEYRPFLFRICMNVDNSSSHNTRRSFIKFHQAENWDWQQQKWLRIDRLHIPPQDLDRIFYFFSFFNSPPQEGSTSSKSDKDRAEPCREDLNTLVGITTVFSVPLTVISDCTWGEINVIVWSIAFSVHAVVWL